eukprot:TRINITY_DN3648_c0_g3_i1.p1 TRINITY_DN3648_c0_g3~~TRINITY_DN3648_c0_g3_i1.p1  ORF type:complete len:489 (+),score=66.38 TRINITY_DN3648_c0_g3_i1:55-1521(+)
MPKKHTTRIVSLVVVISATWAVGFQFLFNANESSGDWTAYKGSHHSATPLQDSTTPPRDNPAPPVLSLDVHKMQLLYEYAQGGFQTEIWWDAVKCEGMLMSARKSKVECKTAEKIEISSDPKVEKYLRENYGPDFMRVMLRGPEITMGKTEYKKNCLYHTTFRTTKKGDYILTAELVYEQFNAINEAKEKTWYDYSQQSLTDGYPSLTCNMDQLQHNVPGRWSDAGPDTSDFKKEFPQYWLSLGKKETKLNAFTPDLLGRMDFKRRYEWTPSTGLHKKYSKDMILNLLKGKTLYFFGDSHMRMTFYGLLSRLGVKYAFDKVWKGDRSDTIPSHGVTVAYVASYFLNTSRPSAVEMLMKPNKTVIAGVGQHHASGCWTLAKHANTVENALRDFDRHNTSLIWFGIPAHPMNRHMRVVQHRTDCRNNLRHYLFAKAQTELVSFRGYPIVDTFAKSWPMIHTSPDGAHYYNWVREAWIDDIFASYEAMQKK